MTEHDYLKYLLWSEELAAQRAPDPGDIMALLQRSRELEEERKRLLTVLKERLESTRDDIA